MTQEDVAYDLTDPSLMFRDKEGIEPVTGPMQWVWHVKSPTGYPPLIADDRPWYWTGSSLL